MLYFRINQDYGTQIIFITILMLSRGYYYCENAWCCYCVCTVMVLIV